MLHTPGPWEITSKHSVHFIRAKDTEVIVAIVGLKNDPVAVANARLVAAAPELLAATKAWVAWWDALAASTDPTVQEELKADNDALLPPPDSLIAALRAAIVTAER